MTSEPQTPQCRCSQSNPGEVFPLGASERCPVHGQPKPSPEAAALRRYDLITNYRAGSSIEEMERADDGEWIRYEDVAAALLAAAEREQELIRKVKDSAGGIVTEYKQWNGSWFCHPGCTYWHDGYHVEACRFDRAPKEQADASASARQAEHERLREALKRIEKWFGEFPPTGRTWNHDGSGGEMSYAACYGSNGERDYMRQIARDALHPPAAESALGPVCPTCGDIAMCKCETLTRTVAAIPGPAHPLRPHAEGFVGLRVREDQTAPIPLNEWQERAIKQWAADDRLWTTQETVELNLHIFARTILASQ